MDNQQTRSKSHLTHGRGDHLNMTGGGEGMNNQMQRSIHDMETFKKIKQEQSAPFFKSTRVQTCSHVMMKNGKAIAVAYPLEKTGWKNPNSYVNTQKSSEIESFSR